MPDQQTCAPSVIVTLPAQLDAAAAEQAADQITAAFTPGVRVVIADLTAAACCDRSAIRNLLKAHRKATVRGRQVRFAIRPGGPLHQITGFADTHPLLAVYPTLQHALTGRSPIPPRNRGLPAATISPAPFAAVRRAAPAAMTASRTTRTRGQMALARRGAACDRRAWRAAP
ncbi:MAG TPA: STAS domain-containing protein [Streptosporangiaceae bacterium]